MAELNLTELRKVAEAAAQGPWEVRMGYVGASRVPFVSLPKCDGIRVPREPDAQHIAAFDPPTVLALLDRVAKLEAVVGRVETLAEEWQPLRWSQDGVEYVLNGPGLGYSRSLRAALAGDGDE